MVNINLWLSSIWQTLYKDKILNNLIDLKDDGLLIKYEIFLIGLRFKND